MDKKKICDLYKKGKSIREVAKILTHSPVTIRNVLKEFKLTRTHKDSIILRNKTHKDIFERFIYSKKNPKYGKEHHNWKGGYIRKDGYKIISINGEQRLEHRYLWEQHYQKIIPVGFQIHHINGDKLDNQIKNLKLLSNSEHQKRRNLERNEKGQFINSCRININT